MDNNVASSFFSNDILGNYYWQVRDETICIPGTEKALWGKRHTTETLLEAVSAFMMQYPPLKQRCRAFHNC